MKKKIEFHKIDYSVLFILNAVGMILELVASRLLSPYFGNSNFVWTAIIGIILLAGSLGNLIGGKIASRVHARFYTCMLLLFASIYLAVTPLVDAPILGGITGNDFGVQFSSVVASIIFFLIPATILGIITPIIMKEYIGDGKDKGRESGRITAIIAIGSLVGTFAGGFFLIPAIGTRMIFVLIAITIMLSVPFLRPLQKFKNPKLNMVFYISFVITIIVMIAAVVIVGNRDAKSEMVGSISIDTEYGRVLIEDDMLDDEPVRYYKQSGAYSSATFLNEDKKYDLVFGYVKKYDKMFDFLDVKKTAMIGGAAYQYPKYFIANFPEKSMDVIEIDSKSTEIAKKYFFLDDLISEYNLKETGRLGLYNEDGRVFLANSKVKYDAILNDAFSGETPVGTLATKEAAQIIEDHLAKDGVYMSNVLGAVSGYKGKFLRSEVKTLQDVFEYVYVVPVYEDVDPGDYINWMVIATNNNKYVPKNIVDLKTTDYDILLTDDYCPIDSLVLTDYFD